MKRPSLLKLVLLSCLLSSPSPAFPLGIEILIAGGVKWAIPVVTTGWCIWNEMKHRLRDRQGEEIKKKVQDLSQNVIKLRTHMDVRFDQAREQVGELVNGVSRLDRRGAAVEQRLKRVHLSQFALGWWLTTGQRELQREVRQYSRVLLASNLILNRRVQTLQTTSTEVESRLHSIESQLKELKRQQKESSSNQQQILANQKMLLGSRNRLLSYSLPSCRSMRVQSTTAGASLYFFGTIKESSASPAAIEGATT